MTWSWAELPIARIVRLAGADADTIELFLDPLPEDAPAVVTYVAGNSVSASETVEVILRELEIIAIGLFPAWLPGAGDLDGPGGLGRSAVREMALQLAAGSRHFGPFLADLAVRALDCTGPYLPGRVRTGARFTTEARASGLARVLAATFGRTHAAMLVRIPEGLSVAEERALLSGLEWLAHRGDLGVWLIGAPLTDADRIETVRVPLGHRTAVSPPMPSMTRPPNTIHVPAAAGKPHPSSAAEHALETALARCDWAAGRIWNQTYQPHPMASPIRTDLMWRAERCVVEIDGDDHRAPSKFADDRSRDVQLQLDGFAVLRFTNDRILTDTQIVLEQLKQFLQGRRLGTIEGQ